MKLGSMSSLRVISALSVCIAGLSASNAFAANDGVNNGSFETPTAGTAFPDNGNIGGADMWNSFQSAFVTSTLQAHSGTQSAMNNGTTAPLYQQDFASAAELVGKTYSFTYWIYNNGATNNIRFDADIRNTNNVANGTTGTGTAVRTIITPAMAPVGVWTQFTSTFTGGTGVQTPETDRLRFTFTTTATGGANPVPVTAAGTWFVDDVSGGVGVPEPTSLAALSILGTLIRRRRA